MPLVCATDFSPASTRAATIAAGIARRLDTPLVLLHVIPLPVIAHVRGDPVLLPLPGLRSLRQRARESRATVELDAEVRRLRATGAKVSGELSVGEPAAEICIAAADDGAPLVVIGSRELGAARRFVVGSVGDRLLASSPSPILVVRGDARDLERWAGGGGTLDVLVAIDADAALLHVAALARLLFDAGDCRFHHAHVLHVPGFQLRASAADAGSATLEITADDQAEGLKILSRRAGLPPPAQFHLLRGDPAGELAAFASRFAPGLLMVGTQRGSAWLHRSVAGGVLGGAAVPVAIAPAKE